MGFTKFFRRRTLIFPRKSTTQEIIGFDDKGAFDTCLRKNMAGSIPRPLWRDDLPERSDDGR